MTRWINSNVFKFLFISMIFYAPKIQAAYVPTHLLLNDYRKSNSHYNIYKTSNEQVLERICNNKPRPCDKCRGKFYTVTNEPFGKNFIVVRDSVNRFLYLHNIVCNDSKIAWYVKYPCKNHIHTIRFVNSEWIGEPIIDYTKDVYIYSVLAFIGLFCCSPFIYDMIFSKEARNSITNSYTDVFLLIVAIVFIGLMVFLAITSSNNNVNIRQSYCVGIVNADSTLIDTVTYKIDSTYHK